MVIANHALLYWPVSFDVCRSFYIRSIPCLSFNNGLSFHNVDKQPLTGLDTLQIEPYKLLRLDIVQQNLVNPGLLRLVITKIMIIG